MKSSAISASASVLFLLGAAASSAFALGTTPDILFYGNSFTNNVNVPGIFSSVAQAAGQVAPSYVNAAVNSQTLAYHIANNTAVISSSAQTGSWDYVVLQEYSTKPTSIAYGGAGNPTGFKNDAVTLYNLVKANSAGVKPILYETWSRQPTNQAELGNFYPGLTANGTGPLPYTAAANQMQSELHTNYYAARTLLGASAGLAPVGDAFQAMGFNTDLYQSDLYHESNKGGLMAAMLIYEQIYKDNLADVSYATMNSKLTLSNYGIPDAATWTTFATLADTQTAAVPEPTAMVLLGLGSVAVLARRRRVAM